GSQRCGLGNAWRRGIVRLDDLERAFRSTEVHDVAIAAHDRQKAFRGERREIARAKRSAVEPPFLIAPRTKVALSDTITAYADIAYALRHRLPRRWVDDVHFGCRDHKAGLALLKIEQFDRRVCDPAAFGRSVRTDEAVADSASDRFHERALKPPP